MKLESGHYDGIDLRAYDIVIFVPYLESNWNSLPTIRRLGNK
jgi:hypothetical protein